MKRTLLAFSIGLILSNAAHAAPATTTVTDQATLTAHDGEVNIENTWGINLYQDQSFNYSDDIKIDYKLTTNALGEVGVIQVFNSNVIFGKTNIVANIENGVTASDVSAVKLKSGSPAATAAVVSAEFAANSSFTINGNDQMRIIGVDIHGGSGSLTARLNENTTITLNDAGIGSRGLLAYLTGSKVEAQDDFLVEINSNGANYIRAISAEGWIGGSSSVNGGEIALNGTTTVNLLNGGDRTTAINAYRTGSKITAQKAVTITNITNSPSAILYGLYASDGGSIDFADTAYITLSGGADNSAAATVYSGSDITLTGADINVDAGYAFLANGADSVITGNSARYVINGNMLSENDGAINITMADNSAFNGITTLDTSASTLDLTLNGAQSVWNMAGDSVLSNLSLNGATLSYNTPVTATFTPKELVVTGNYTGNDAVLVLNTVLGNDDSATDKLIVQGDIEAGTTKVAINNIAGAGGQTINGIKIVEVGGQSIGEFVQQNRIVAGAYDYQVVKGAADENWYLSSSVSPIEPPPVSPPTPEPEDSNNEQILRPEFGSYLANNYAANTMFLTRLHDRLGETQYTDVLTGEQKVTSMWMRHVGGHTRFKNSNEQLKTQSNRYVAQIGGDLAQWSSDGLDRWHLGAMAGYGNNQSNTTSHAINRESRGKVDGYSAGLYGTWYANQADKTGSYVDTWVLYNWFDNEVTGDERATETYKSRGITASIESGYSFKLGENDRDSYWLQPKAQVIWMDVQAKDHYEQADVTGARTKVSDKTKGNLQTRLGLRAYVNGHSHWDDGKDRKFQPFVEANWIHNTNNYAVQIADTRDEMRGTKNIGELKLGIEGQLSKRLNVWGNAAQQIGDDGYSDTSAMLGIKYQF
ncbi:autotransporter outer membrane beta-barrel domain-containing protein [Limnobaculum zhutongyuii]|nr:autotransporter outer membrane beta-barrel domain-containing protein [Limnobaculum zhutongyuii]